MALRSLRWCNLEVSRLAGSLSMAVLEGMVMAELVHMQDLAVPVLLISRPALALQAQVHLRLATLQLHLATLRLLRASLSQALLMEELRRRAQHSRPPRQRTPRRLRPCTLHPHRHHTRLLLQRIRRPLLVTHPNLQLQVIVQHLQPIARPLHNTAPARPKVPRRAILQRLLHTARRRPHTRVPPLQCTALQVQSSAPIGELLLPPLQSTAQLALLRAILPLRRSTLRPRQRLIRQQVQSTRLHHPLFHLRKSGYMGLRINC